MRRLRDLLRDRRGATAIEYGLICALIFLSIIVSVKGFAALTIRVLYNVANSSGEVL